MAGRVPCLRVSSHAAEARVACRQSRRSRGERFRNVTKCVTVALAAAVRARRSNEPHQISGFARSRRSKSRTSGHTTRAVWRVEALSWMPFVTQYVRSVPWTEGTTDFTDHTDFFLIGSSR